VIGAAIGAFGGFVIASLNASYSGSDTGVVRFFLVYGAIYLVIGSVMVWVANRIRVSDTVQFVLGVLLIPVYIGLMFGTCVAAVNLTS
jgi:Na+/melibiose symporter-like transporter